MHTNRFNSDECRPAYTNGASIYERLQAITLKRTDSFCASISDTEFAEDLRDISIARERRNESDVSLDEYRKKRNLAHKTDNVLYTVILKNSAEKQLDSLPDSVVERVLNQIEALKGIPPTTRNEETH